MGNQILLRNRTDSEAICSLASRPFTSSRLSVLTGVCVPVCVCQVCEAEHTEAHTVGQTGHNIIIPDIDLVSAELEGKTCTPAVQTSFSLSHTHGHILSENSNTGTDYLWMQGPNMHENTLTHRNTDTTSLSSQASE